MLKFKKHTHNLVLFFPSFMMMLFCMIMLFALSSCNKEDQTTSSGNSETSDISATPPSVDDEQTPSETEEESDDTNEVSHLPKSINMSFFQVFSPQKVKINDLFLLPSEADIKIPKTIKLIDGNPENIVIRVNFDQIFCDYLGDKKAFNFLQCKEGKVKLDLKPKDLIRTQDRIVVKIQKNPNKKTIHGLLTFKVSAWLN